MQDISERFVITCDAPLSSALELPGVPVLFSMSGIHKRPEGTGE